MKEIDISSWKRKEQYDFFRSLDYPQYNICFNLDITLFLNYIKENRLPFYYSMIYFIMSCTNTIDEFKYRFRKEKIIYHERIHPSFTEMDTETNLFKIITIEMNGGCKDFIEKAKKASSRQTHFIDATLEARDDLVYISAIPWISFTSISHTISLNAMDSVPRISWGKFFIENNRTLLPFSVQVNHAFVDGIHIAQLKDEIEKNLERPEALLG